MAPSLLRALCPPFRCRQDEASLTLLLPVPCIQPHSLQGDVGTNHYSLRFSSATTAYSLFLRFPPANRLAAPETSVSVSPHNAAIGLAKAPGSDGHWEKFSFGLDASALQVTALRAGCSACSQPRHSLALRRAAPAFGAVYKWYLRELLGYLSSESCDQASVQRHG